MTINVYWSPHIVPYLYNQNSILYKDPEPLLSSLYKKIYKNLDPDNSWFSCPAVSGYNKNTYIVKSPFDIDVFFQNDIAYFKNGAIADEWVSVRPRVIGNSLMIDVAAGVIFFSDSPLIMTAVPAYMHKTKYTKYGYYVPGEYDISSWFRPVDFCFQLWENNEKFKLDVGEEIFYIKFNTDEKINLIRFNMNREIYDISKKCINYKNSKKRVPLKELYDIFKKSGDKEKLLKLLAMKSFNS